MRRTADSVARIEGAESAEQPASRGSGTPSEPLELMDVPAAVVCALCGDPDCVGCADVEEQTQPSGIVAIVPWERPGLGAPQRLWSTAKVATLSAESFFGALPDGDVGTALRFAVLAELCAVSGLCAVAVPVLLAFTPWLLEAVSKDAGLRGLVVRAVAFGLPTFALGMVAIHAAHGWGLDAGARKHGANARGTRGLRFGLYSCGWDLVTLPAGLALLTLTDGVKAAGRAAPLAMNVPGRAASAYLRGVYRLDAVAIRSASRRALGVATVLVVATCVALFGGGAALLLL